MSEEEEQQSDEISEEEDDEATEILNRKLIFSADSPLAAMIGAIDKENYAKIKRVLGSDYIEGNKIDKWFTTNIDGYYFTFFPTVEDALISAKEQWSSFEEIDEAFIDKIIRIPGLENVITKIIGKPKNSFEKNL